MKVKVGDKVKYNRGGILYGVIKSIGERESYGNSTTIWANWKNTKEEALKVQDNMGLLSNGGTLGMLSDGADMFMTKFEVGWDDETNGE